jgi:hypothetical protein
MPELTDAPRYPVHAADGFLDVLDRLENDLAIAVKFVSLPGKVGALDGPSRTLLINKDKPLIDQVWTMIQCWKVVTLGPEASPQAVRENAFMHLVAG